jgi:glucosamine--fructose-6-phosphate aminotransferase (isomerizing)
MCGIVGYTGKKQALPILLQGLRDLEYRGYDSAGIAVLDKGKIDRVREVGKVAHISIDSNGDPVGVVIQNDEVYNMQKMIFEFNWSNLSL